MQGRSCPQSQSTFCIPVRLQGKVTIIKAFRVIILPEDKALPQALVTCTTHSCCCCKSWLIAKQAFLCLPEKASLKSAFCTLVRLQGETQKPACLECFLHSSKGQGLARRDVSLECILYSDTLKHEAKGLLGCRTCISVLVLKAIEGMHSLPLKMWRCTICLGSVLSSVNGFEGLLQHLYHFGNFFTIFDFVCFFTSAVKNS